MENKILRKATSFIIIASIVIMSVLFQSSLVSAATLTAPDFTAPTLSASGSVSGTIDAGSEVTILIYRDIEGPQGNIYFADQTTTSSGNFSFTLKLPNDAPANGDLYAVLIGGTGVTTPITKYFIYGSSTAAPSSYSFLSMNLKPTKAFNGVNDVATDSEGNIYVVDYYNNRIVEFTSTGANKWAYGIAGNGVGQFTKPSAIAIDGNGYIYVADSGNSRVVRFKDTANNGTIGEWVSFGSAGAGDQQFNKPVGIYVKGTNVFVADTYNHRIVKFDPADFVTTWQTFGSMGTADGQFRAPMDVAVDAQNNIWVSDTSNNRVQRLSSTGGWVANYAAALPYGITIDSNGFVYVAERMNADIKCVSNGTVYGSKGTGANQFSSPVGVFVDANDKMFIADISATKIKVSAKQ